MTLTCLVGRCEKGQTVLGYVHLGQCLKATAFQCWKSKLNQDGCSVSLLSKTVGALTNPGTK